MATIGYARVSTHDQNADGQHDVLNAAGCEAIYTDQASGVYEERPELKQLWKFLRAGDTLVITKLDRLGRSVKHLTELAGDLNRRDIDLPVLDQGIDTRTPAGRLVFHVLAAVAEFEHDLIIDRTHAGLAAARACGCVTVLPRTLVGGLHLRDCRAGWSCMSSFVRGLRVYVDECKIKGYYIAAAVVMSNDVSRD